MIAKHEKESYHQVGWYGGLAKGAMRNRLPLSQNSRITNADENKREQQLV
jgi:hypothetical protein